MTEECKNCWTCRHQETVAYCCHNELICHACNWRVDGPWRDDIAAWLDQHGQENDNGPDHAFYGPHIDAPACPGWEQGTDHRPEKKKSWGYAQ